MNYNEIINKFKAMAAAKGIEARDESYDDTLRIAYYFNDTWIGSASYRGCVEHPEYMTCYAIEYAREQIKYLAEKARSYSY